MPQYVTGEGERGIDIARNVLGDARAFREIVGIADPFRPLEAGTTLFLPGGAPVSNTPNGISVPSPPAPGRDFANLSGGEQDQIINVVNAFAALIGYPKAFDLQAVDNMVANKGLIGANPEEIFTFLFSTISPADQARFPWAQFGLDEVTYHQEAARYQSMWYDLAGGTIPADVLKEAIGKQWTVQQMMQGGQHAAAEGKLNAPWLATGQTFSQIQENFFSAFGHMPANVDTLRAWFGFRLGAQQTRAGGEAQVGLTQQAQTRIHDVEVR